MPALNLDQFDRQKLLLDAHRHYRTTASVTKGIFGFVTTITIGVPKDTFDWLVTEIGDVVGSGATSFINGDHSFAGDREELDFGRIHSTLLGLWRDILL